VKSAVMLEDYFCIMYTTRQILEVLRIKKKELEARYPICEFGLFGSFARGTQTEKSDIDVLVDFSKPIDAFDYIRIAHELEDAFNAKVDLVSRKGIKRHYLPHVEESLVHI